MSDNLVTFEKLAYVKPSQLEIAPEIARKRETDLGVDSVLKSSILANGVFDPLTVYLDGKKAYVVDGSRRLKASQEIEAEGTAIKVPVAVITKGELDQMLAYKYAANAEELRRADDFGTRVETFQMLAEKYGWSAEKIGDFTGYSHQTVYNYLKVNTVPVLVKAIQAGKIAPKTAEKYITAEFAVKDEKSGKPVKIKDEKTGQLQMKYDSNKIKEALKADIANATSLGVTKKIQPKHTTNPGKASELSYGKTWLNKILDAEAGLVPVEFLAFIKLYLGKSTEKEALKLAAKGQLGLDWLSEVDFRSAKDIKAEKKEKAKQNAKNGAKAAKKANPAVSEDEDDDFDVDSIDA